uniref:dihydroorotase n=1 Tax=Setaria italica TaxID=4555 RepID=K3XTB9_SETIT
MQAATTTTTVRAHPHMKPPSGVGLLPPAASSSPRQLPRFSVPEPEGDRHGSHVAAGGGGANHHASPTTGTSTARHFGRAIIMPNLKPPVTTTAHALEYREEIMKALPPGSGPENTVWWLISRSFEPLMTLYLTDNTSPEEIKLGRKSGVVCAVKLYPAGATTNSQDGVTDIGKCLPVLKEMVRQEMPLLVHGEVTDPHVDTFDREKVFIDRILAPLVKKLPQLKIVMEHITTMDEVNFIESCEEGHVAATVTPQHLLLNRNALFQGGLQPHNYCLPGLKKRDSLHFLSNYENHFLNRHDDNHFGSKYDQIFHHQYGTFLALTVLPHDKRNKERSCGCAGIYSAPIALSLYAKVFEEAGALDKLEAFTSFNGPDFYGLPRNTSKIVPRKNAWKVPATYTYSSGEIVPMFTGSTLEWLPSDQTEE